MSKYPDQPPPYGFQQPPPAGQPMPPTQVVRVVNTTAMGPTTQTMQCPSCNASISTRIESEPTTKTHLIALFLCLIGCWPCCCIPYCMDTCKNANHYCPKCNSFLGTYQS